MSEEALPPYEDFRAEWLTEIEAGDPSSFEKGSRFAVKLVEEWLELAEDDELIICDGSGDGGIDLAVLSRGDVDENGNSGDTWYLVQSKYGSAWAGPTTPTIEGNKIISTLDGQRKNLSSLADGVLERLRNFRNQASDDDRIVLVFATVDPPGEEERDVFNEIRGFGQYKFGAMFDVESISVRTIYDRLADEIHARKSDQLVVPLRGALAQGASDLLVGVSHLADLYDFLRQYRSLTQNLDRLYDRTGC